MFAGYDILNLLWNRSKKYEMDDFQNIEVQLYLLFEQLANRQFDWEGLPEEIDSYKVEQMLFFTGQAVYFKQGENNIILPCANQGLLNIYGQYVSVRPIAINGTYFPTLYVKDYYDTSYSLVEKQNAVLVRNNEQCVPTFALIRPLVSRLIFIWKSLGINNGLSRLQTLIQANKDSASVIKQQIKSIIESDEGIAVVSDKKNILQELQTFNLGVEYKPQDYWYDFDKTWNMILTILGINNNPESEKKERLVVDEVNINNELTSLTNDIRYYFRNMSANEINKMFNTNIKVIKLPKVEEVKEDKEVEDVEEPIKQ